MVTVPKARNTVQPGALPGVRVDTNQPLSTFGGGSAAAQTTETAKSLNNQVSSDVMDVVIKQKQNADDVRIQDADLEASRAQTDIQTKATQMLGKDALGASDFVEEEWKKRSGTIREGLSNDAQRQSFDKIQKVRSADLYRITQQHTAVETRKYDDATTEAYLNNTMNTAAVNYLDSQPGGQVDQNIFLQEQAVRKYGARYGISDDTLNSKISDVKSKTYTAVINQMLANKQDQMADEYYKSKKDFIAADDRTKLETAIEQGIMLGEGQRQADDIFSKNSGNRNAAFERASKIKDPELRKQTEGELERMFTRQSQAERADNQKSYQLASQLVEKNETPPANITVNLTADQRKSLASRQKQINAGVQPNTDWDSYYKLKTMAAENKNQFARENLMEYRHILADAEFKDLTNLQSSLARNDAAAQSSLNGFRTSKQIVDDTLVSAGINVDSKRPSDQRRIAQFRRMIDENIQIIQGQTRKEAGPEDVQRIADNLLINTIVKHGGFMGLDKEKKVFELEYKDIPTKERMVIIGEMKKRGKIPSERTVLEYYRRGIEFKRGR